MQRQRSAVYRKYSRRGGAETSLGKDLIWLAAVGIPAQAGLVCLSCKWKLEMGLEMTFLFPVQNVTPMWSVSLQQRMLCIL